LPALPLVANERVAWRVSRKLEGAAVPVLDVSRWLGHASITETADTYGHLMPEAEDRARTALTAHSARAVMAWSWRRATSIGVSQGGEP